MAELADAHDSKSCGVIHESSILSRGTRQEKSKRFGSLRWVTNLYSIGGVKTNSQFRIFREENFLIINSENNF